MPIGPSGERLPYPGEGPPMGNPMGAVGGENPDALMQELQMLGQRAQEIIGQLQAMGVDPSQMGGQATPMGPPVGNPMGGPQVGGPVGPPGLL
jgi:hypothetical protein